MDKKEKWIKGSVYNFRRVVQTNSNILWSNKLTSNIQNNDK